MIILQADFAFISEPKYKGLPGTAGLYTLAQTLFHDFLLEKHAASLSAAVIGGEVWRQFVTGESIELEHASYKLASCTATSYADAKLAAYAG